MPMGRRTLFGRNIHCRRSWSGSTRRGRQRRQPL